MRLFLLIILFYFSCSIFGQDSLLIDTTVKRFTSIVQDTMIADSTSSALNDFPIKNKKPRKKVQRTKIKEDLIVIKKDNTNTVEPSGNVKGLIIIGVLFIAAIVVFAFSRSTFGTTDKHGTTSSKDEDFISDYLSRMLMPRRDYYRNVYLKSEAWKRKRYIVLKRDNWRCVYCGGRATQVHHTRYAKRNIGKEPIEWLVSICRTCHDSKH